VKKFRSETGDHVATIASVGLLAYASADIAHHALGHGCACLALGGSIVSLSSTFVNCSLHGATIDLAGPLANLVLGLFAMLVARAVSQATAPTKLFWTLVAAFNMFWFSLQLVFSVMTKTDDWAWALHRLGAADPVRLGLLGVGSLTYLLTVPFAAAELAPFAHPPDRVSRIIFIVWVTAGAIACATAALDHNALRTVFLRALPQSVLPPIGLFFVPKRAVKRSSPGIVAADVVFSRRWIVAAAIVAVASILLLGPGFAVTI
jgi:hypothetical protein